jgi:IPT/TIG domain
MVANITTITPNVGPVSGGTAVSLAGLGFSNCRAQVAFANGNDIRTVTAVVVSNSQMTCQTPPFDQTWNGVAASVGVYDNSLPGWVYKSGAFTVGATPATITAVAPAGGPTAGGTSVTVTGTRLTQCQNQFWLRQGTWQLAVAATATATTLVGTTPDLSGHDGSADVGVYDAAAQTWVWSPAAFYIGIAASGTPPGVWDQTLWDGSIWQARRFAPGAGWAYDWRVWYQYQGKVLWDLTDLVVEARWSTDSHSPGDGTFRGDLQPGALQLQVHDAAHVAETLSKLGTIWLHYGPGNFTWGFYLETVTRQLVAPNDATAADVVIQATPWPLRLTTDCSTFVRPAERVDTRLNALASYLNQNAALNLPAYDANVAGQSHVVPAVAVVSWSTTITPSVLSILRAAAADGVAWVDATVAASGLGRFRLNYARWEAGTKRNLQASDIVAGVPYDSSMDDVITHIEWDATGPDGSTTTNVGTSSSLNTFGDSKVTMRVLADMKTPGSADANPVVLTSANLMKGNSDPTVARLSTVTAYSGQRTTAATGADGPPWNPAAHVWGPVDILHWLPPPGQTWGISDYWVTKTAHRLRAAAWESAHTVEPYTAASPLPA